MQKPSVEIPVERHILDTCNVRLIHCSNECQRMKHLQTLIDKCKLESHTSNKNNHPSKKNSFT